MTDFFFSSREITGVAHSALEDNAHVIFSCFMSNRREMG